MNETKKLVGKVNELPGIGKKVSERLAVDLIESKEENLETLNEIVSMLEQLEVDKETNTIKRIGEEVRFQEGKPLLILLTNVEVIRFKELLRDDYNYFNLGMNKPSQISKRLVDRELYSNLINLIQRYGITEVIFGLSNRTDSEIIIRTITNEILRGNTELKVTRLATGIPVGASVLHTDEETIRRATINREKI